MKATHTDESYTYRLSHTHYLRKRGGRRKREGESVYLLHTPRRRKPSGSRSQVPPMTNHGDKLGV